jgi:hypothetical protein
MNTSDFTYLLHNPSALDKDKISDMSAIIEEFPYFQSARAIYLKGLKDLGSFKYNQELKTTAAYTTDRSVLFDFITSEVFLQNDISTHIKQNFELISTINVTEFQDISSISSVKTDLKSASIKDHSESLLELGKPLQFDKSETFSFSEWLSVAQKKPIDRSVPSISKSESERDEKFALIDAFISNKPKLKPLDKESKLINIAEESIFETEDLMTETLARIYVEQKNYDNAIQSYRILSLKYPEKSSLFADQIQAIKVLQQKNKI